MLTGDPGLQGRPLLSHQQTARRAELLGQEPSSAVTGSHSFFLKTLDPEWGGRNFCCCANQTSGREKKV